MAIRLKPTYRHRVQRCVRCDDDYHVPRGYGHNYGLVADVGFVCMFCLGRFDLPAYAKISRYNYPDGTQCFRDEDGKLCRL